MTALDARFGRRGGRLSPWGKYVPAFDVGERVWLDDHRVLVLEHKARRRYLVRFLSNGATLIVSESHLQAVA